MSARTTDNSTEEFNGYSPTWCPGCGDWAIGACIKRAFSSLKLDPSSVFVVFGIGCSGNMNDFLNAYAIHSLHGRSLPNAIGAKLAQHDKPVVVIAGDGDCYGEGGNHFLHACRGNHDITVIIHDNGVYGLTTGQVSPRAYKGQVSKSTPEGIIELPLNPLTLALTQGATFVAQGFAGEPAKLPDLIAQGIRHKGFSLINILQPCVTFNKHNTYEYFRDKTYHVGEKYDPSDYKTALITCAEPTHIEKFPLGILFQTERPAFTDEVTELSGKTLISRKRFTDFEKILDEYK